ncbi:MAG: hypothetical protein KKG75_03100 [Nanoarchaeota archaeon]|nr:hypothetical protein [Nanoarchaeota archaeon]
MVIDTEIVKELVGEIAGKDVIDLVELIKGKEDVSEFKIAEKLGITVNQVRNMLYRLYSFNLVSFTRKKDQKKGWYIYYWTFHERKGYELFVKLKKEKLQVLKERFESEKTGSYFICPNECVRLGLEAAMEHDFKCPDCGQLLQQEDNEKRIRTIEKEINETKLQLEKPFVETPKRKPREPKKETAGRKPAKRVSKKRKPTKRRTIKRKTTRKKPVRKRRPKRKQIKRKTISKKSVKRKISKRKKPNKREPVKKRKSRKSK